MLKFYWSDHLYARYCSVVAMQPVLQERGTKFLVREAEKLSCLRGIKIFKHLEIYLLLVEQSREQLTKVEYQKIYTLVVLFLSTSNAIARNILASDQNDFQKRKAYLAIRLADYFNLVLTKVETREQSIEQILRLEHSDSGTRLERLG